MKWRPDIVNDGHLSFMQILKLLEVLLGEPIPEEHLVESGIAVESVTRYMFYFWKYSSMKFEESWKSGRVDLMLDTVVGAT